MSDYCEISCLTKSYPTPRGPAIIVKDFNLRIRKGEFVTLIGHSGCGKSTVLSMLAGLNDITAGGIILAGKELAGAGPDRGVVFQSPCLLPWMTALENVMLGVNQVFYTADRTERHQIAQYYLSVVGLAEAMHKRPAELSQGMRQRVGIARAFALETEDAFARRALRDARLAHALRIAASAGSICGAKTPSRHSWSHTTWTRRCFCPIASSDDRRPGGGGG